MERRFMSKVLLPGTRHFTFLILLLWTFAQARAQSAGDSFLPLPQKQALKSELVVLGEKLFYDTRLSHDLSLSCASCHELTRGGIDLRDTQGVRSDRFNAPTLFNVGFHFKYFWNGRAENLEEQIELTVRSPTVFNNDWPRIEERLQGDASYRPLLQRMGSGKNLNAELIKKALAEFERSLVTPDSRFDRYLRGDKDALSPMEKRGLQLFKTLGCSSCHQGALLGGNMFQKFGIFGRIPADRLISPRDLGRYSITQKEEDRFVFKVPSLRNVELTAPYFHNGAAATLHDAVAIMSRAQLGRELADEEREHIVAFLKTLTGEWRGRPLK